MRPMTLAQVAQATRGRLVFGSGETFIERVSTDTRALERGDLFIALRGENYDAHDFVAEAVAKGAAGVVVDRYDEGMKGAAVVFVRDTLTALGDLAHAYRHSLSAQFIAVTGSCGKTTVKEMIGCVLAGSLHAAVARRSFNNNVGVPLTILDAGTDAQAVVLEMGTNHPGEIAQLAAIADPDVGVITTVAPTHLEGLGSLAGVARAKAELLDGLSPGGLGILNWDNRWIRRIASWGDYRFVTFGRSKDSDVRAVGTAETAEGSTFTVGKTRFALSLPGRHNVSNALAAIAVGLRFSIAPEDIAARLAKARLPEMRLERRRVGDVELVVDCYNANPASVRAALKVLARIGRRRVFVFAGMGELGEHSAHWHERVGRLVARAGVDIFVTIGDDAAISAQAAQDSCHAHACATVEQALDVLRGTLRAGDTVLFKASRSKKLEMLVDALSQSLAHCSV